MLLLFLFLCVRSYKCLDNDVIMLSVPCYYLNYSTMIMTVVAYYGFPNNKDQDSHQCLYPLYSPYPLLQYKHEFWVESTPPPPTHQMYTEIHYLFFLPQDQLSLHRWLWCFTWPKEALKIPHDDTRLCKGHAVVSGCPTVSPWVGQSLFQINCPTSHTTLIWDTICPTFSLWNNFPHRSVPPSSQSPVNIFQYQSLHASFWVNYLQRAPYVLNPPLFSIYGQNSVKIVTIPYTWRHW